MALNDLIIFILMFSALFVLFVCVPYFIIFREYDSKHAQKRIQEEEKKFTVMFHTQYLKGRLKAAKEFEGRDKAAEYASHYIGFLKDSYPSDWVDEIQRNVHV